MVGRSSVAALLAVVGGCATTDVADAADTDRGKSTTAVPANYRQLVANRILGTTDRQKIRRAQISRPQVAWTGLLNGGNQPVVCAVIMRETSFSRRGGIVGLSRSRMERLQRLGTRMELVIAPASRRLMKS
jgi:hypothetical protein